MIITHTSPDFDAIASVWLLKRFGGFDAVPVQFVNTGNPDPALLEQAAAVVDTGRIYDVTRWRFDHHQLPGKEANSTCAAWMVWDWLHARAAIPSEAFDTLVAIEPLIQLVFQGDTGRREADYSRRLGIHALLSNQKRQGADDHTLLAYGCHLLDNLAQSLTSQAEAQRSLQAHTVYESADGLVVALLNAPLGATHAAHEKGARLVVFHDETTKARGVMRGGEGQDVHVGALIQRIAYLADDTPLAHELHKWYCHQAGFFAGRGTAKAPVDDALEVPIVEIARIVDGAWER